MTPTTLAADAAQALQGVTDGPWIANGAAVNTKPDESAVCVCVSMGTRNRREAEADARFIAFARAWVPEAAAALSEQNAVLAAQLADVQIAMPTEPGGFVGDIYYGHPVKSTMGTHRWDGSQWVALPSEAETLLVLLADARAERDALAAQVAGLTRERGKMQRSRDRYREAWEAEKRRFTEARALTKGTPE